MHFSEERQSDTNDVEVEHHILNPIKHFDAVVDTHENFQFDVEDLVSEDRDDSESSESNDDWNQDEINWDEAFDDVLITKDNWTSDIQKPPATFREQLAAWAVQPGVLHVHVNGLLEILRTHPCHSDLPTDVRTLLKTPRKVQLTKMHPGEYFHFGILAGLEQVFSLIVFPPHTFFLEINIDGLPIFSKSTGKQLWVILAVVRNLNSLKKIPFIIGIYFGLEKPVGGPNTFLRAFVTELKYLIANGFTLNGFQFQISKVIFICDSPARAFISGVKYHSGFSSCGRCVTIGETAISASEVRRLVSPRGRRVFPCTSALLRTNESFRLRHDPDHHNYYSIIEEIELVDMVLDFPSDPMHLVDEGAGKKLFMTLLEDSDYKISPINVRRVNEAMTSLSDFTPRDFARRSRSFCSKFKATEWSQALKYTSPVVFRNRLSPERYAHLLTLHVAIKILSSDRFCYRLNSYAKNLLEVFVKNAAILYGKTFITYNIHNLIHLADNVMLFGPLHTFSAYIFENELGKIKRLLRKSEKPLQQIVKRLAELERNAEHEVTGEREVRLRVENKKGPLLTLFPVSTV